MTQSEKKESLTKLLRVSYSEQNYFITTDQITGKRFAVAEFGEPGSLNIKSNFMTFKEMECFLFGVNAVTSNVLENKNEQAIIWSVCDFEEKAKSNFEELKKDHPEEHKHLQSWEQMYDKSKFAYELERMITRHDAERGVTWLDVEEHLFYCII